jgi:AcrR family transcriptional regulator
MSKGEITRARILESGFELFLSKGSDAVSLRQIAGAAGLSPMAIYRHFDDKAALELALLKYAFDTFEEFLRASQGGESPVDELRALARQFFRFAFERSPQFRFLFLSEARMFVSGQEQRIAAIARPTFALLHDVVQRCSREGLIATGDSFATSLDVLGFCVGRAALVLSGNLEQRGKSTTKEAIVAFDRYIGLLQSAKSIQERRKSR